jgi:transcriptional regulator with XRE-family HTH domain
MRAWEKDKELCDRKTRAGLTNRDLANATGMPPSTVSSKLCGFAPMSYAERCAIIEAIERAEKQHNDVSKG